MRWLTVSILAISLNGLARVAGFTFWQAIFLGTTLTLLAVSIGTKEAKR